MATHHMANSHILKVSICARYKETSPRWVSFCGELPQAANEPHTPHRSQRLLHKDRPLWLRPNLRVVVTDRTGALMLLLYLSNKRSMLFLIG